MNPRALTELVPDFAQQGFPTEYVCNYAGFWIFHPKGKLSVPLVPPNFRKKGYHVVSLNKVAKWMAERAEKVDVQIYPGFAGDQLLIEGTRVGRGSANSVPGGPLAALAFALARAARRGRPLKAGELVSTGAATGIHDIRIGQGAAVVFAGVGEIRCRAVRAQPAGIGERDASAIRATC